MGRYSLSYDPLLDAVRKEIVKFIGSPILSSKHPPPVHRRAVGDLSMFCPRFCRYISSWNHLPVDVFPSPLNSLLVYVSYQQG